jgi:predicted Holliday junction resolvase-like endonuclease
MEILTLLLEIVIIPLLGALTVYIVTLLKAKTKEITDKIENDKADKYIYMLSNTITKCVTATNQTYVDNLKKENAFSKEAQQEALKMTADAVLAILSDEAKTYLPTIVGDLNTYILTQIESEINRLK